MVRHPCPAPTNQTWHARMPYHAVFGFLIPLLVAVLRVNNQSTNKEQKFFSQMSYHAVFGFLIPLLVAVLQVNNQSTNKYSFETHPVNLWVFLLATLVYCFAFVSQYYNPSYAQLYSLLAVISGSLSSVSLFSVFLPDLLGRLIYIPWAFVSIVVSRSLIISLCCWLYQMIMKTFFQVAGIWNRFKGSGLTEQPRLPV
ncbi:hypothetical protein QYF36_012255 [Acer negundo]|nr:hypothetical protein QYF36_012255 [Acer negundo]